MYILDLSPELTVVRNVQN